MNKIAYIISMVNGMEPFIHREIKALKNKGLDITLFITKYRNDSIYGPKPNWVYHTINRWTFVYHFVLSLFRRFSILPSLMIIAYKTSSFIDLVIAMYFLHIMQKDNINKIHSHFGDHKLFIGYYCSKLLDLPLSVTIHSHELHVNPNEKMFRYSLKRCDKIIAISNYTKRILTSKYDVSTDKISVISLFVDTKKYVKNRKFKVLTIGRFIQQKGWIYLFRAAKLLDPAKVEFIIIGYGGYDTDVIELMERLNVEDRIVIFPRMSHTQLRYFFNTCDAYCLPSISHPTQGKEGIPVVLIEAMAMGMPVIATRCGGVPELVDSILVDEKSPEQIACAINELMSKRDTLGEIGAANRQHVVSNYSTKNLTELYDYLSQ